MIRVLVAEDSAVTREYLAWVLEQDPHLHVICAAQDGAEAVRRIAETRPDVVLMDVYMPRMDGYEATRQIMELCPTPVVLVSSGFDDREILMSFEALDAGALAVIPKPHGFGHPEEAESTARLVETIHLMSEVRVVRRTRRRDTSASAHHGMDAEHWASAGGTRTTLAPRVIAIGASTGGPTALAELLSHSCGPLSVPILVAQHIAPGFCTGLAHWLEAVTRLPVCVAIDGVPASPGAVYLAPDSAHLGISANGTLRLSHQAGEEGFCPSASHLFRSVAASCGPASVGVLLTGMGRDGAAGLLEMRRTGATTIVQDRESSVVYGMPGEAVRLGAATHVLPPAGIGQLLRALTEPATHPRATDAPASSPPRRAL